MQSKILKVLKCARKLITKRERWTTGAFARDIGGLPCTSYSPDACCFCAAGAVQRVSDKLLRESFFKDVHESAKMNDIVINGLSTASRKIPTDSYGYISIADFNDHTTHNKVLKLFDNLIQHLENGNELETT